MTEPKEGDRVRCTLGENVIVGKVLAPVTDTHHHLSIIYGNTRFALIDPVVWTVEVIEPEPDNYPDEAGLYEGAVVRDRHGFAWERHKSGWWRTGGVSMYYSWKQIQKDGPFTRLIPAPDPDDEQQVEALAQAMRRADGRAQHAGLDVARAALTFLRDGGA